MVEIEPQFEFEDMESFHGGDDKMSFKMIVLNQLNKISGNANCELRGGYWQKKVIPMQGGIDKTSEEYVPDTRETYSNSIEFLHDILYPHFQKDKEMKKASENYLKEISARLKKYKADGIFTDEEKNKFREERVEICRDLFIELNCFLERKNYFGERIV